MNKRTGLRTTAAAAAAVFTFAQAFSVPALPNPIREVSQEELSEITGIGLIPFEGAEEVLFSVIDDKTAEMDFVYQGMPFFYRAEYTSETETYDMSGFYYEWNEEGQTQVAYCDACFRACDEAATLCWLDIVPGINYTLGSARYVSLDEMIETAQMCFHPAQDEDWYEETDFAESDDGEWTSVESQPSDFIEYYTWKYDDSDSYFRSYGNQTYAFYDSELNSDGKICFWEPAEEEDAIHLFDGDGNVCLSMVITEAYEDHPVLTDSEGRTLSALDSAANGTWSCQMNAAFLEDHTLIMAAGLPFYVSNKVQADLKIGDVLNNTGIDFMGIEVESIEKKADDLFWINDLYELTYQPQADAWLLVDGDPVYAQIGSCQITEDTKITDAEGQEIPDLEEYLYQHDYVEASVTTKGGSAESIVITMAD